MLQQSAFFLTVIYILISVINGQVDTELCPTGPSSSISDSRWYPVPPRFEIITELNDNREVIELSQAFSPMRDAIAINSKNGMAQFYWNFDENEQFEVLTVLVNNLPLPQCVRQEIKPDSQTSVIQPRTFIVKPSILLGYNEINQKNPDWGVSYVGDEIIRGFPAKVFTSCFFVENIKATVSAIYHVSDVTKFQAYLPQNQSLILQIQVKIKPRVGPREEYTYHVFRYNPNPSRREERQALETPAGVFCPNRATGLPIPTNIPSRVSSNSEIYLPRLNASIYSSHGLYDTEFEFTRLDLWLPDPAGSAAWIHFTEIHDFATGLSYRYDHGQRQCQVANITQDSTDAVPLDDNPSVIQIGRPEHIFLLDDMDYQYTGEKRCRDRVWCHVWIGEKLGANNLVERREWYWASTINDVPLVELIPMKLNIKQFLEGALVNIIESSIFDYRRRPFTVFEVDYTLADCYRALGPALNYNIAVLSFKINNEKKFPVMTNINYLRLHVWETLTFAMFIRPTRISSVTVDEDDTDIIVTFTLLDAPPVTGPVETTFQEKTLDPLVERLESIINSNDLVFRARTGTRQVILRARANSLNVRHRSTQNVEMTSGPKITGLWFGFIIAGVVVGAVGGFFVFRKLTST